MPDTPEKLPTPLTRNQQRKLFRQENQRQQEAQTRRRNIFKGVGAITLLAAGAALFSRLRGGQSEQPATPAQTDTQVLDAEVAGLKPDSAEQALWTGPLSYTTASQPQINLGDPRAEGIKNTRLQNTLRLMSQSKNKVFNETFELIQQYRKNGDLQIIPLDQPRILNGKRVNASTTQVVVGDKLIWTIGIDSDYVLNHSDSIGLAFNLVNEIQHVKDKIAFQQNLSKQFPNLTPKEREAKEEERLSNPDEFAAQEARGRATLLEAFIYQYKMGYRNPSLQTDAAQLVRLKRSDKDAQSLEWRDYIKNKYLS